MAVSESCLSVWIRAVSRSSRRNWKSRLRVLWCIVRIVHPQQTMLGLTGTCGSSENTDGTKLSKQRTSSLTETSPTEPPDGRSALPPRWRLTQRSRHECGLIRLGIRLLKHQWREQRLGQLRSTCRRSTTVSRGLASLRFRPWLRLNRVLRFALLSGSGTLLGLLWGMFRVSGRLQMTTMVGGFYMLPLSLLVLARSLFS